MERVPWHKALFDRALARVQKSHVLFSRCSDGLGDDLVAIDWTRNGKCYCQNDCECMAEVGNNDRYLITRDSRVGALPHECGPGQGRWVEDWMWENSCRPEFCTSWGENSYDCCAIPENSPSYRNEFRGKVGSDGFEKVLIGTWGARETFLQGRKGRAAKNSVLTSGAKQLKC